MFKRYPISCYRVKKKMNMFKNIRQLSPLESTLTHPSASVDSKPLTPTLSPYQQHQKKQGEGVAVLTTGR
jgi:hypothetical protein